MKIKDLLQKAKSKLKDFSPSPDLDVEILLSFVLKKNREFILSNLEEEISKKEEQKFNQLLARRIAGEPVAYLTSLKSFYGRDFKVTKDTLIPRPETESLIEKTLEYLHKELYPSRKSFIIDLGTGSGCILITLAKEIFKNSAFSAKKENLNFIGTDISPKALEIAKKNQEILIPEEKIIFLKSNLLDFLNKKRHDFENSQVIITANLPYLSKEIYQNCPKSVLDFEPKTALFAEKEGLGLYLKLLEQVKIKKLDKIAYNLYLIFEISPEQKPIAEEVFKEIIPEARLKFSKDLAGKWRFIEILF